MLNVFPHRVITKSTPKVIVVPEGSCLSADVKGSLLARALFVHAYICFGMPKHHGGIP